MVICTIYLVLEPMLLPAILNFLSKIEIDQDEMCDFCRLNCRPPKDIFKFSSMISVSLIFFFK